MSIVIQLQKFEGPLALLLYLIRKEEMDIMDIKIHEITKQYLEYIKLIREFDIEVAGEFIAMASTLIQIKSRMLLPQYDENGEVIEQEDPRKELVQKLLEYQKYQEAAKLLYDRPLLGRDIWVRGQREVLKDQEDEIVLEDNALFSLISAYRRVVKTAGKKVHKVAQKLQSIASRILQMKERLLVGTQVRMSELLESTESKARETLITFLSLLELGKMGFVSLYQTETYGEIYINTVKPIETDVISRVEEYDALHSEEAANSLFEKSAKEMAMAVNEEEFELKDQEDQPQLTMDLEAGIETEMASDDEILAAEQEMEQLESFALTQDSGELQSEALIQTSEELEILGEVVEASDLTNDLDANLENESENGDRGLDV